MSTINILALQTELAWQDPAANWQHFEAYLKDRTGIDVVVLPEMFNTGFSMDSETIAEATNGPTLDWMKRQALALDAAITGSVAVCDQG